MSNSTLAQVALRQAIEHPKDGFVGIVNDMLSVCRDHALQIDWRDNRCHIKSVRDESEAVLEMPLRKSIFRAILARVATLCDEQSPGTFSPYGGSGTLVVGSDARLIIQASWVNTTVEQCLNLTCIHISNEAQPDGRLQSDAVRVADRS
jgi:hypothetical protein